MRALTGEESALCATLDPIVEQYARRQADKSPSVGYAEFRSAGNLGAVKAVLGWSPETGKTLKQYASVYIWKEMEHAGKQTRQTWAREAMSAVAATSLVDDDDASQARDPWADEAVVHAASRTALTSRAAGFLVAMFEHAARDAEMDVADRVALEQGRHKTRAIVETQPQATRDVYRLMFVEHKSYTETADALGIDRSRVQRIARDIESLLTERLSAA